MSSIQTACSLHVRAEQVSALYDGDLDTVAAAALREHLVTCDVCQQRLASYARISSMLRTQTTPQPDVWLRQGVLAARTQSASVSRAGAAWRVVAIAAAMLVVVGGFAGVLLRQARPHRIAASSRPTVVVQVQTPTTEPLPPGWTTLLPGRRFSVGGSRGLAVSRARPGRLVGCSVSGPYGAQASDQTLEISDDGGQTWRESPIPNLQPAMNCVVVVDQVHPDTFVVGDQISSFGPSGDNQLDITTDAGHTWRLLTMPTGRFNLDTFSFQGPTLVDDHLIGMVMLNVAGETTWRWGDLSLDGKLTFLDSTLPYPDAVSRQNGIMAFAVDPTDALRIYAVIASKYDPAHPSSDIYLYTTTNAGATWHETHDFVFGGRIQLWAPAPGALYFWVAYPEKSPTGNPLQMSTDGGVTWRDVTPAGLAIDSVWFGPDGQIVLLDVPTGFSTARLDELDPATGKLTPLGAFPPASTTGYETIISGGADPRIIVADPNTTFACPLP